MSTAPAQTVPETSTLPEYVPLTRPQNRRRSRRAAVKATGQRDRVVKRAMARALTPRKQRHELAMAGVRERQRGWDQHFKAGGSVDPKGRACAAGEARTAAWDPHHVDPAELEVYYSAEPHELGHAKVTLHPGKCTDEELTTWRARAAERGYLSREQLDDLLVAVKRLGGAITSARLGELAQAAREDRDLSELLDQGGEG